MERYLIEAATGTLLAMSARKIKEVYVDPETGETITKETPTIVDIKKKDINPEEDVTDVSVNDDLDNDDIDDDSDLDIDLNNLSDEEKEQLQKLISGDDNDLQESESEMLVNLGLINLDI